MKKTGFTTVLMFVSILFNAQGLNFELRPDYKLPIRKKELVGALKLSDVTPGYPGKWMDEYVSVDIVSICNGKIMKAQGDNDLLTANQKSILNSVDLGADISIDVQYKTTNAATGTIDNRNMNYTVTVIPEVEATFKGGDIQLNKFIKENAVDKVSDTYPVDKPMPAGSFGLNGQSEPEQYANKWSIISFIINEQGIAEDIKLKVSCGDSITDKVLMDAIRKMPKWIPAHNAGVKVKQKFIFTVGQGGC